MSTETQTQEQVFLSVKDMVKLVPISKAHLYSMVRNGKVKAYRFGKKILFKREEILNQINNGIQ